MGLDLSPPPPADSTLIRDRAVFFVPGFDPASARQHRERYRREGARQAAIQGYTLRPDADANAGADAAPSPQAWHVQAQIDGQRCRARIEVLSWSDIVARQMRAGPLVSYTRLVRTAWIYAKSGALWRLARLRKGPVLAIAYPVVVLLLQAGLALGLLVGSAALGSSLGGVLGGVTGALAGAVAGLALLRWFKRHDGRLLAHYLIHDFAYAVQDGGAYPAELQARLAEFAQTVAAARADEVLVVGHSSGAALAVSLLARLEREGRLPPAQIGLLSLGHAIPMLSFLPGATQLRADLAQLSESGRITWLDVSAPADGCAFALCDPVAVSGVASPGKRWPLVVSAAFSNTLSKTRRRALRWRFFERHFQYLNAFDRPGLYDYFAITAGPLSLAQRIQGWRPSKARIETALSPHRDRAA